ncbi:MAG: TonB-dependent receptor [Bacteroidota bacterium]|nr:TonB-dependent receptor [Bacteroidota bacterium]
MDFSTHFPPPYEGRRINKTTKAINSFYKIDPATKRKFIMRIKLITIILFAACLHISAAGFSQNVTISERNANLETVLNKIEQQSGFDVFMQTELLARSNKVTIDVKNITLEKALEKVFKGQPLTYAIVGHTIVLKEKGASKSSSDKNAGLTINADRVVTGKLLDAQTKEPLIGATIAVKDVKRATVAALDGTFKINVPEGSTTLVFTYIGYITKELTITGADLGTITMDPVSASVKEVTVTANPSLAIDRHTPIAASSVGKVYIEEKGAGAEFPELLKAAPGVMTSKGGGGYGDSRVNIRGFSSNNVALLINGIPVNDVEAGKIYWNDWAGLADVTTSMQVQRGLGASKVAVPSLGGTINITTKSTELQEGGTISQSIGTFNSYKTVLSYSTGLTDKGWSTSFLLSRSQGDGYAPGLYYTGYSYFANISKVLSPTQTLSFNFMGATQNHGQRYTFNTIGTYRSSPLGIRYNSDYGYLNGQLLSAEQNYYNKPLASLNHSWKIDETSSLATVVYGSWGTGAARYLAGTNTTLTPGNGTANVPRTGDIYSPIDFNAIVKSNVANADGSSSRYFQNTVNNHQQYGILSAYKKKLGDIDLLAGIDGRYYRGEHFYQMDDLLGGSYIADIRNNSVTSPSGNINDPNAHIGVGDKFNNDYTYQVASEGAYVQAEYNKNDLSAFVTVAASNTGNRRIDYFNYTTGSPDATSKWVNFLGYQAKGGANYNIDAHNNIFANIGYIQRAPLVANIFLDKDNDLNPNAKPEKLMSYELGYGFVSSMFSANVNLYRSTYKDRAKTSVLTDQTDNSLYTVNISGINEVHQGVEVDAKFRPINAVTLSGSLSIGDFHYTSNTGPTQITSDKGKTLNQDALLLKGLKVGEFGTSNTSAQTTAALGLDVQVLPKVKVGANYNFYGRYYASFDPSKITTTQQQQKDGSILPFTNYQLPNFSTLDLNVVYRFKFAGLDASFIANVYNVLNTAYVADAFETGIPANAAAYSFPTRISNMGVWYGSPRTYMTTLKINF